MPVSIYEHPAWIENKNHSMHPGGIYLTQQLLAGFPLDEHARVLDLGCGSGNSLCLLAEKTVSALGIDLSLPLLRYTHQRNAGIGLAQAIAEKLPFATASLDAILSECTLSLFALPSALHECARVLKPAGLLMVSDLFARNPAGLAALRALPGDTCVGRALLQSELECWLRQCGFQIVRWNDQSQALRTFSLCQLLTASQVDPFDLQIAAARARLGYFSMLARKEA